MAQDGGRHLQYKSGIAFGRLQRGAYDPYLGLVN